MVCFVTTLPKTPMGRKGKAFEALKALTEPKLQARQDTAGNVRKLQSSGAERCYTSNMEKLRRRPRKRLLMPFRIDPNLSQEELQHGYLASLY